MKFIKTVSISIAAMAVAFFFGVAAYLIYANFGPRENDADDIRIDETANVVSHIKALNEFASAGCYREIVLSEAKPNRLVNNKVGNKLASMLHKENGLISDDLCIIARGNVRAGFDLSQISAADVHISGDTLSVTLPPAQILDVTVNPSDFDVYVESGQWSHRQVVALEQRAKAQIRTDAIDSGILAQADSIGRQRLSSILSTLGFTTIILN